ncbi:hypothetical protein ES703_96533 [subsurface metagenome]
MVIDLTKKKEKEKKLYEPIRTALLDRFKAKGDCYLEVTAESISNRIRKFLDHDSATILEIEKKRPDLLGYVKVKTKSGHRKQENFKAEIAILERYRDHVKSSGASFAWKMRLEKAKSLLERK